VVRVALRGARADFLRAVDVCFSEMLRTPDRFPQVYRQARKALLRRFPYPDDKYLPSYLLLGRTDADAFHVLFAADVEGDDVRVVTAHRPDAGEWQDDLKMRRPGR
jgi:hypothetical protein